MVQSSSDLLAAGTQLGQDGVDALLVDGAKGGGGNAQLHPTVLRGHPEAALMQVGKETAAGLVVGVRDVVTGPHGLAGDLANSAHVATPGSGLATHGPGGFGPAPPAGPGTLRCGRCCRRSARARGSHSRARADGAGAERAAHYAFPGGGLQAAAGAWRRPAAGPGGRVGRPQRV